MKLGVFAGTFDPPHIGHIKIINYLIDKKLIDKVLVIATGTYWHKQNITELNKRLDMLDLISNDNIIIDKKHNNIKYTYQILETLSKEYKEDELDLIIGADNANTLFKWKCYEEILKYNIIVIPRNNIKVKLKGDRINVIDKKNINISSTEIRNNIMNMKNTFLLKKLDKSVLLYINKNNLYRDNS